MKRKHLRILVPILVLVLAAGVLLLQQLRKTEAVYFRTAAYGRLTGNLEGDPFTVHRWDGGDSYTPVFTTEEDVWPEAGAISGDTLYYTVLTEENESRVYRADLKTGQRELLADLDCQVWVLEVCGKDLFLAVYDPEAGYRLGVLRSGEFLDCAPISGVSHQMISCDDSGCWYTAYESAETGPSLCYLPADTLAPETVYESIPRPIELQAAPEGVYLSCQFREDIDAGAFSLVFYPRDGSGTVKLLTDLTPDGPEVSDKKRVRFQGCTTLWEDKLFYVTATDYWPNPEGEDRGEYLHCLDRKTGKVTDYGRIDPDTDVGTVHFSYLLTCGKQGFILTESDWWATDKETANRYSLYTWDGRRTELRLDGSGE